MAKQLYKASQWQSIAINDVLRLHCRRNEDGMAVYEEGWDDERVFSEVKDPEPHKPININHVSGQRRRMFGNIKHPASAPAAGITAADVAALREDVKRAIDRGDRLQARVGAVEQRLTEAERVLQNMVKIYEQRYQPPAGRPQASPPDTANGKLNI